MVYLHCIGNISYWNKLIQGDDIIFHLHHTFQKQSSLSQYEIVTANGRLKLSIPTLKKTRKGAYGGVEIDNSTNWQVEHWRGIENAYKKSPFFLYYDYKIAAIYTSKYTLLIDFNKALFEALAACIKETSPIVYDTDNAVYFVESERVNNMTSYPQVFDHKHPFIQDVSLLDLLFNIGPETKDFLAQISV